MIRNKMNFARSLQTSSDHRGELLYIMYHGTTLQNALKIKRNGFIPSADGTLGRGVYLSRSFQKASDYPRYLQVGDEKVVLMLKVNVGKVFRIPFLDHRLQKSWHQAGYDTAWLPPNCGMEEDCVWDPQRIEVMVILNMDRIAIDECVKTNFHKMVFATNPGYRGPRTYIMYHGTILQRALNIMRNGFIPSSDGILGRGVYVTRSFLKATFYPISGRQIKVVLKLQVMVGRVIRISYQGHPLQKTWHEAGFDTAWIPPKCGMVTSGLEEDCVFDPQRIEVLEILKHDGTKYNL